MSIFRLCHDFWQPILQQIVESKSLNQNEIDSLLMQLSECLLNSLGKFWTENRNFGSENDELCEDSDSDDDEKSTTLSTRLPQSICTTLYLCLRLFSTNVARDFGAKFYNDAKISLEKLDKNGLDCQGKVVLTVCEAFGMSGNFDDEPDVQYLMQLAAAVDSVEINVSTWLQCSNCLNAHIGAIVCLYTKTQKYGEHNDLASTLVGKIFDGAVRRISDRSSSDLCKVGGAKLLHGILGQVRPQNFIIARQSFKQLCTFATYQNDCAIENGAGASSWLCAIRLSLALYLATPRDNAMHIEQEEKLILQELLRCNVEPLMLALHCATPNEGTVAVFRNSICCNFILALTQKLFGEPNKVRHSCFSSLKPLPNALLSSLARFCNDVTFRISFGPILPILLQLLHALFACYHSQLGVEFAKNAVDTIVKLAACQDTHVSSAAVISLLELCQTIICTGGPNFTSCTPELLHVALTDVKRICTEAQNPSDWSECRMQLVTFLLSCVENRWRYFSPQNNLIEGNKFAENMQASNAMFFDAKTAELEGEKGMKLISERAQQHFLQLCSILECFGELLVRESEPGIARHIVNGLIRLNDKFALFQKATFQYRLSDQYLSTLLYILCMQPYDSFCDDLLSLLVALITCTGQPYFPKGKLKLEKAFKTQPLVGYMPNDESFVDTVLDRWMQFGNSTTDDDKDAVKSALLQVSLSISAAR